MRRSHPHLVHFGGLLVVFCFLFASAGVGLAQDATPAGAGDAHPVHIHAGTCEELDPAPAFPLNDIVGPEAAADSEAAAGSPIGVEVSTTTVEATLESIVSGGHAFNVHESAENIGNYIACGDIGGTIVDGMLSVGLHQSNDSGYAGIAVLQEAGEQTEVTIYLAHGLSGAAVSAPATAAADHAAHGDAAAETVLIDIKDFAYNPDPVTIKVGQSVTWTNQDAAPHTATSKDRDVLQSGTLNQGDSFTQQFDTPGTYEYFCEFHPNMMGVIIVE